MADLAAADFTYSISEERMDGNSYVKRIVDISFGDGSSTMPAAGLPLTKAKMGFPVHIQSLKVLEGIVNVSSSLVPMSFDYDASAEKILMYQSPAVSHNHALHLNDGDVADGATTRINAGTNLLGANTGADIAIAGVADTSGAGGIVTEAIAAQGLSAFVGAPDAASSIRVEVVGY